MMNNFKYISLSISTAFILSACGGGSGGSESSLSSNVNTGISTDYSKYAWGINSNIDSTFKSKYSVSDNAHINITSAWSKSNKGKNIKVAVIDEDFQVTHPDIKDKIIATYNTQNGSSNVTNTNISDYSHGTAVAGIIASNSLGTAPNVDLILINIDLSDSITDTTSTLTSADLVEAFAKADELGAKVINCSWGGGVPSQNVQDEIKRLKDKNITVVFSSGNGDKNGKALDLDLVGNDDESELSTVIGVGASAADNDVAYYSNYGSAIDVIAPGGGSNYIGTPMIGVPSLDLLGNEGANVGYNLINNDYSFTQGTSFAAPTTTGVVALMLAVNPTLTADRIRTILTTTTSKVGQSNGADYSVGNFDTKRAYGKIDASAAVQQAEDDI